MRVLSTGMGVHHIYVQRACGAKALATEEGGLPVEARETYYALEERGKAQRCAARRAPRRPRDGALACVCVCGGVCGRRVWG